MMSNSKSPTYQSCVNEDRLISEIIDLWLELRAIRSLMEEEQNVELPTFKLDHSGPFERFMSDKSKIESDWESECERIDFFFQTHITPDLLAFEQLSDEDKYMLTN